MQVQICERNHQPSDDVTVYKVIKFFSCLKIHLWGLLCSFTLSFSFMQEWFFGCVMFYWSCNYLYLIRTSFLCCIQLLPCIIHNASTTSIWSVIDQHVLKSVDAIDLRFILILFTSFLFANNLYEFFPKIFMQMYLRECCFFESMLICTIFIWWHNMHFLLMHFHV